MDVQHVRSKRCHKTPVLTSLKQGVKKIENEVDSLKKYFNAATFSFGGNETESSSCFEKSHNIKKEINHLQHDCQKFKLLLNPNIEKTKSYFLDMEDLTLDIEDEVAILEKHLKNYGYEPIELDTSSIQESECLADSLYCDSEISENDLSITPEFNIPSASFFQKRNEESVNKVAVGNEPATPELNIQSVEPEKKPRHVLSSPLPYSNIGSTSKLGNVARRLDF